jgi:hypothetical protein
VNWRRSPGYPRDFFNNADFGNHSHFATKCGFDSHLVAVQAHRRRGCTAANLHIADYRPWDAFFSGTLYFSGVAFPDY